MRGLKELQMSDSSRVLNKSSAIVAPKHIEDTDHLISATAGQKLGTTGQTSDTSAVGSVGETLLKTIGSLNG